MNDSAGSVFHVKGQLTVELWEALWRLWETARCVQALARKLSILFRSGWHGSIAALGRHATGDLGIPLPLPILVVGSFAKSSDFMAPGLNLPIVPLLRKFTRYRVPAESTAGPSIKSVYSPGRVNRRLVNSAGSAAAKPGAAMVNIGRTLFFPLPPWGERGG